MITRLRERTSELHKELEQDNLANKILDHSISLQEYKELLFQNFIAYRAAEVQIAKFMPGYKAEKTTRLKEDLENLGLTEFDINLEFKCENKAEAVGAAYVIEGSAMGGMLIGKEIKNCEALSELPAQKFFNAERGNMKGWNEYLKFLRSEDFTEAEIEAAAIKAQDTFLLFKKAFSIHNYQL
jgi:heme oxygenase (biliverdin-IX-beta and delta-forming)